MKRPLKIVLRIVAVLVVVAVLGIAFFYIRFKPDEHGRIVPWGESIDTSVLPRFRSSLDSPNGFVIFEGLPHQGWEHDLLKTEVASKKTIKIHGFHFYSKLLTPSEGDRRSLITALADEGGIVEWGGMKLCGGYHPDYTVQWRGSDGGLYQALICFGCHEIKLYGDGMQLYADLSERTYEMLKSTLLPYGDQRPKTKG